MRYPANCVPPFREFNFVTYYHFTLLPSTLLHFYCTQLNFILLYFTSQQIFNECILGTLSSKTIVLVTHQIHLLHRCDLIIVLEHGAIKACGTYDELQNSGEVKLLKTIYLFIYLFIYSLIHSFIHLSALTMLSLLQTFIVSHREWHITSFLLTN